MSSGHKPISFTKKLSNFLKDRYLWTSPTSHKPLILISTLLYSSLQALELPKQKLTSKDQTPFPSLSPQPQQISNAS
ncbi:hypothetical protein CR513_60434, partial [Mucuna pruriens]